MTKLPAASTTTTSRSTRCMPVRSGGRRRSGAGVPDADAPPPTTHRATTQRSTGTRIASWLVVPRAHPVRRRITPVRRTRCRGRRGLVVSRAGDIDLEELALQEVGELG